jgi:hypothetical protein
MKGNQNPIGFEDNNTNDYSSILTENIGLTLHAQMLGRKSFHLKSSRD